MNKYRIKKNKNTNNWDIFFAGYSPATKVTSKPTWEEALFDVNFLLNADRAFGLMKELQRKDR